MRIARDEGKGEKGDWANNLFNSGIWQMRVCVCLGYTIRVPEEPQKPQSASTICGFLHFYLNIICHCSIAVVGFPFIVKVLVSRHRLVE